MGAAILRRAVPIHQGHVPIQPEPTALLRRSQESLDSPWIEQATFCVHFGWLIDVYFVGDL
jgi:hypothetical protein